MTAPQALDWQKNPRSLQAAGQHRRFQRRYAYLLMGLALLGMIAFLIYNGTATASYYMTVADLSSDPALVGKSVRVAGAVDGESIHFDPASQTLSFSVAHIPNDGGAMRQGGGLGQVLHDALKNPAVPRLQVRWQNAEMPDLLQHEAQAIMTGRLDANGLFHATQVLLKCPTRYSDEVPAQSIGGGAG